MYIDIQESCPKCGKDLNSYYTSKSIDGKTIKIYFECKDCILEFKHHYKVVLEKTEELL